MHTFSNLQKIKAYHFLISKDQSILCIPFSNLQKIKAYYAYHFLISKDQSILCIPLSNLPAPPLFINSVCYDLPCVYVQLFHLQKIKAYYAYHFLISLPHPFSLTLCVMICHVSMYNYFISKRSKHTMHTIF